ncbi:GNAT family N-acetyltransferase [Magnetospirillum sulfuroxidans]|nr:GNAT family N-acetyltransferase [Magnetospirillum sulfuroxidans]
MDLIPAALAHAQLLSSIHCICFTDMWSPEAMVELLEMPGAEGLLAVDGGSLTPSTQPPGPAGMVLWRNIGDEAEILSIAVLPPWRRSGLGWQLLDAAVRSSIAKGAAVMFLEVAADNAGAQNLYLRSGFVKVGVRKRYYADKDAWVMRRDFY